MNINTRKLTMVAMLSALAYVVMAIGRIPIVLFLKYDPKDVIITIGGFLFGPFTSFTIAAIVSLTEMFTLSETGFIGCLMNIISSASFACPAAFIYQKKRNLSAAVIGLIIGCCLMTIMMLAWNYLITPFYLGYPREAVLKMLIPVFLPFNVLKGGLNIALTLWLYKPLVRAFKKTGLIQNTPEHIEKSPKIGLLLIAALLFATCFFFILVLKGLL